MPAHSRLLHSLCLRLAALVVTASCFPAATFTQYFGQNKVRYETFDFKVLTTQHFDIYHYPEERDAVEQAARMAERWHARLSKILGHQLTIRQPVILYANHPDFRSTTAIPGFIGATTGGVTEALRRRLVMPLAGPLGETDHVLGHELVHAFQFDITSRLAQQGGGLPGALQLPLWFVEGMAEYLSLGPVDPHTAMWMRDAVRRDELPDIKDLDNPKYFPYRYGHAFWAFVGGRYGDQTIGQLLIDAARAGNVDGAIQAVLGVTTDELSQQWHASLTSEYGPVLQQTSPPEKYGRIVLSEETGGGELNVSPVLSPDGKHIIFFSERDLFSIDLFLADAATGETQDKITETAVDPHFDALQFVNSAGSWSADGRRFAFGSISSGKPELTIYDVQRRRTESRLDFPDLGEIHHPTWSPDGRFIAFSANVAGVTDLFIVDVQTNKVRRLTSDAFADLQPAWSTDGTSIAFVTDRFGSNLSNLSFGHHRLALIDPATARIEPVPGFPTGKHINPQWSSDGGALYFISDRDGISNIYRVSVATGEIAQITDLQTGVSGITSLSPAFSVAANTNQIAFSVYDAGDYNVLLLDSAAVAGKPPSDVVAALSAAVLPPRQRASGEVASLLGTPQAGLIPPRQFETSDYDASPGFDYFAPPSISVGVSNYGSLVGGGTALYFSDLLGYHHLMTAFQTISTTGNFLRNFSAVAAYQNQKHRWNWGFAGGQFPFLTGGFGRFLANVNGEPAVVEQSVLFWEINREISGVVSYPFNRAQRIEFTSGYRNVDFAAEQQTVAFSTITGQLLLNQTQDIPTPDALHLATSAAALVYDTSIFGGTSPVLGQRYRLEVAGLGGSLNYSTLLTDYRKYFWLVRPLTLAGRVLHFGRYGGDSEDDRLQDLFIGYPSLVRGYSPGSFSVNECGGATDGSCPAFDQLVGSRIVVGNLELRLPIFGPLGVIPSRSAPPVETAFFYDAGYAWRGISETLSRDPVTSYGATLRFNIFGFAIGQLSYAHPNERPGKGWIWEFSLVPGF